MPDKEKILIVDDDEAIVKMLKVRLGHEGYDTELAVDGNTAVTLAEEYRPDIILLDLAMPSVTGIDVMEKLKHSTFNKDVPVIIITAHPQMIKLVEGYDNIKETLIKPFDVPRLLTAIRGIISEEE